MENVKLKDENMTTGTEKERLTVPAFVSLSMQSGNATFGSFHAKERGNWKRIRGRGKRIPSTFYFLLLRKIRISNTWKR